MLCRPQDATENEERESQRVNSTFAGGFNVSSKMGKGRVKTLVAVVLLELIISLCLLKKLPSEKAKDFVPSDNLDVKNQVTYDFSSRVEVLIS